GPHGQVAEPVAVAPGPEGQPRRARGGGEARGERHVVSAPDPRIGPLGAGEGAQVGWRHGGRGRRAPLGRGGDGRGRRVWGGPRARRGRIGDGRRRDGAGTVAGGEGDEQ